MATATRPSKTQLVVWDLAVGEVPTTQRGYARTVYVQRVEDELRFYKSHVSDTDAAKSNSVAELVIRVTTFAAVVKRLGGMKTSNIERVWDPDRPPGSTRWSFVKKARNSCVFRARCGEEYTVKLSVMEQIVQEFGSR